MIASRPGLALSIALSLALASGNSLAQSAADLAARRDLLTHAQDARTAGDHAQALDLARRAGQIQMTPSVRIFIAEEQAAVGQVLEGLANARLCEQEAAADQTLRNREVIQSRCHEVAEQLSARTARVVVELSPDAPQNAEVSLRRDVLNPALYGTPVPVLAGTVDVHATAPGYAPFNASVSAPAGSETRVTISLHREGEAGNAQPATGGAAARPAEHPMESHESGGLPTGGVVVAAAGVLLLAGSGVLFVLRNQNAAQLEQSCEHRTDGSIHCLDTPENHQLLSTAHTEDLLADVALGVGAAALVAGGAWVLFGRGNSTNERVSLRVVPGRAGATITIGGVF